MGLRDLVSLPVDMGWRHVLFANWPVDPDVVAAHLPATLSVDTYDGRAWLSVVPFTNVAVRPRGFPERVGFRLPELNLRTYVRPDEAALRHENDADTTDESGGRDAVEPGAATGESESDGADRRGVYFFNLDAHGVLGVTGARLFHHLPYFYAAMSLRIVDGTVRFTSRRRHPGARPCEFAATYDPRGERYRSDSGSLAEFLTERYRYYTETPGGELRYARVRHARWPLSDVDAEIRRNQLFEANGFATPGGDPVVLYSPGVDVVASGSRRIGRPTVRDGPVPRD